MFKQKIAYIIEKKLNAKKLANNKKKYDRVMKSVDKMITELSSHDEFNSSCRPLILEYIINTLLDYICAESIFKPLCNLNSFPIPFFSNFYNEKGNTLSFNDSSKKANVNLSSTKIYLHPWNNVRTRESLVNISENDFVYDKNNHFAIYYPYINLCYVTCGNHSINAGRYFRKGSIVADEYDLSACFPHIETDGSYWFNTHTNEPLIPVDDYRFAAIFTIAKMKYELNDH